MIYYIAVVLVLLLVVAAIEIKGLKKKVKRIDHRLSNTLIEKQNLLSQKKSSEIRTGLIAETLAPFLDSFPYDPMRSHFLGNPIDYIVFDDDAVVFIEVKSGKSRLTPIQRTIKKLIQDKKVTWKQIRIE